MKPNLQRQENNRLWQKIIVYFGKQTLNFYDVTKMNNMEKVYD